MPTIVGFGECPECGKLSLICSVSNPQRTRVKCVSCDWERTIRWEEEDTKIFNPGEEGDIDRRW